jgi:UTP--glucose-1-phosphate uridylyltransferase
MSRLHKIVFPAAGMGTRFLPATKATPKEMLTIVDKPLIQYGVEEALAAGLDEVVMVTGRGKRSIEDHFDVSDELERTLRDKGKTDLYERMSEISHMAEIAYVRQRQPLGLGHAVACAEHWVSDESFGVSLADELIVSKVPAMRQLRRVYERTGCSVIGLARVPHEHTRRYGMVAAEPEGDLLRLTGMVEKPEPEAAPSDLAMIGRYIFTPHLFDYLRGTDAGAGGEIQLTDAMAELARHEPVYGVVIEGERFDAGQPLGFLLANLNLGLRHADYGEPLRRALSSLLGA